MKSWEKVVPLRKPLLEIPFTDQQQNPESASPGFIVLNFPFCQTQPPLPCESPKNQSPPTTVRALFIPNATVCSSELSPAPAALISFTIFVCNQINAWEPPPLFSSVNPTRSP